jgi:hypothetical protein
MLWPRGNAMNDNYQMSPLSRVLIGILGKATWGALALLLLFAGILLFQRLTPDGKLVLEQGDLGFLGVLVALFFLAIYIIRSIKKEVERPGG